MADMEGAYDFVMLHHTFEHMPAPAEAMQHIARLLKPGRFLLIRIPVADSHA
jgi:SAM-dependent methyltransferase